MKKAVYVILAIVCLVGCQGKKAEEKVAEKKSQSGVKHLSLEQREQIAVQLVQQGMEKLGDGDAVSAIQHFEASIDANPKYLEGYFLLTQTYMRLEENERAVTVLERGVQEFPQNGMLFYLLSLNNEQLDNTLPAVLAAKHSAELFQSQKDIENTKRSLSLLNALIEKAKDEEAAAPRP